MCEALTGWINHMGISTVHPPSQRGGGRHHHLLQDDKFLKYIIEKSGASVVTIDTCDTSGDTKIHIEGTSEQANLAQEVIEDLLLEKNKIPQMKWTRVASGYRPLRADRKYQDELVNGVDSADGLVAVEDIEVAVQTPPTVRQWRCALYPAWPVPVMLRVRVAAV